MTSKEYISTLKGLYKGNVISIVWFMLTGMPGALIGALLFKFLFIALQVMSVWLVFMWFFGNVSSHISDILQYDADSYLYPVLASSMFVASACSSLVSKKIALTGVGNLLNELFSRDEVNLNLSDYKGLVKVLLSIIDSFIPIIFILSVFVLWIYHYPVTAPFFSVFIVVALFFVRGIVGKSARVVRGEKGRDGVSRVKSFYKTLMLPQYIIVVMYSFIAFCILTVSIIFKEYSLKMPSYEILFILSVFAAMQFKSSVGAIVRMGAYYGVVKKVLVYIK